jgi:GTP cyclohydrolase II
VEALITLSPKARLPAPIQAARAAAELAAARPVLIRAGEAAELVLAAEHVTQARLVTLKEWGPLVLVLTPRRAATLRLRQYTQEAIALAVETDWTARFLLALADPARDLDYALHGPLTALREPLSPTRRAALRLASLAGLLPAAIVVSLGEEGAASDLGFIELAAEDALSTAQTEGALSAQLVTSARLPLAPDLSTELIGFRFRGTGLWGTSEAFAHYALAIGRPAGAERPSNRLAAPPPSGTAPLVRLHSECFTGDFLGSLKCDCGDQLRGAILRIAQEGGGYLLYLRQEGRGIGLLNKLRAYHLQDQGLDTVEANERLGFADDERSYAPAARMLEVLGARRIRLLTNNPRKVEGLAAQGIKIVERVSHRFPANPHNAHYLAAKTEKSGHLP